MRRDLSRTDGIGPRSLLGRCSALPQVAWALLIGAAATMSATAVTTLPAPMAPTGGTAQTVDVARLQQFLDGLAPPPTGPMTFVERRMSALLATPLELRGELSLGADGTIDKRVVSPSTERVRIAAGAVTIERAGRAQTLDLRRSRQWAAFHAGIAGLIGRDARRLERAFEVALAESTRGWTLTLRPATGGPARKLPTIIAAGSSKRLTTLRIEQGANEWQEIRFEDPKSPERLAPVSTTGP